MKGGYLFFTLNLFLCTELTSGKIYLREKNDDSFQIIKINKNKDIYRVKRQTGPSNSSPKDDGHLEVHESILNDSNHNEAIIHWSGENSGVMFVLTRERYINGSVPSSTLWRSSDYGSTFAKTNIPTDSLVKYFYACPNDKNLLMFTDIKNKKIYTTENGGTSFKTHALDFSPDKIIFHPTKPRSALAYSYAERKLRATSDFAESWDHISDTANSRFYWAIPDIDADDKNDVVHIEEQDMVTGEFKYRACAKPYCKDLSFNQDLGPIDVDSLLVQNEYIFVQKTSSFDTHLYVSYKRQPFVKAYFPLNVHPQDFSVVNTDENQVFIAADHSERTVKLYLSDTTGQFYIESLDGVLALRQPGGGFDADLHEVKAMNGTFVANIKGEPMLGPKTLISFDQGREWKPIPAPQKDVNGNPYNCQLPDCSLHLHLGFSRTIYGIPYILSEENAPGKILAQGVVGRHLTATDSEVCVFMSSDGGQSWKPLFNGTYNYAILDQGSAMVAIEDTANQYTNEIKYSYTEGESWKTYKFTEKMIHVDGVLNEPGIYSLVVSIFGHINKMSGWSIVKVDFSSILKRKCEDADYEEWKPKIKGPYNCVLGQKLTYKRRLANAECYNGIDYHHALKVENCICVEQDYECDYGYELEKGTTNCKPSSWYDPESPVIECPEGEFYMRSNGYRKVASDKCEKNPKLDQKYQSKNVSCPLMKPEALHIDTQDAKYSVPKNRQVSFILTQEKGSKTSTKYSWNFGNGSTVNVTGLTKASKQNYTFDTRGMKNITVTATNKLGKSTASLLIRVEGEIKGLFLTTSHGSQVNHPVTIEAIPVSKGLTTSGMGDVHMLYRFGDEKPNDKPLLTYDREVKHTYYSAGNFTVTVEAINSVGSQFKTMVVPVYGILETVQLTFNGDTDRINEQTPSWRIMFAEEVRRTLLELSDIGKHDLEVVVLRGIPTKVDVSVLPIRQNTGVDPDIKKIADNYVNKGKNKQIFVKLGNGDYSFGNITVIDAKIVTDDNGNGATKPRSYVAVIVCVPILILAVFISVLVVLYYKKKFTDIRRYSVLRSNSSAEDHLLNSENDDDDDDPPLDPGPAHVRLDDDDDEALQPFGNSPSLVMMTGTNSDDFGNSVNC